jgi:hypothetical protein
MSMDMDSSFNYSFSNINNEVIDTDIVKKEDMNDLKKDILQAYDKDSILGNAEEKMVFRRMIDLPYKKEE